MSLQQTSRVCASDEETRTLALTFTCDLVCTFQCKCMNKDIVPTLHRSTPRQGQRTGSDTPL